MQNGELHMRQAHERTNTCLHMQFLLCTYVCITYKLHPWSTPCLIFSLVVLWVAWWVIQPHFILPKCFTTDWFEMSRRLNMLTVTQYSPHSSDSRNVWPVVPDSSLLSSSLQWEGRVLFKGNKKKLPSPTAVWSYMIVSQTVRDAKTASSQDNHSMNPICLLSWRLPPRSPGYTAAYVPLQVQGNVLTWD